MFVNYSIVWSDGRSDYQTGPFRLDEDIESHRRSIVGWSNVVDCYINKHRDLRRKLIERGDASGSGSTLL